MTMKIVFSYNTSPGRDVKLIADFTSWEPVRMSDEEHAGRYTFVADLVPGTYQYKFMVDGEYILDPLSEETAPCPFGINSVRHVTEKDLLVSQLSGCIRSTLSSALHDLNDVLSKAKQKNDINEEHMMSLSKAKYDAGQDISAKRYSVAVVATMSAGKSTLLNAMLGEKILPSKQEACTAKVYSIEDDDDAAEFMARKIENGKAGEWQPATHQLLQDLNESSADKIEICGNIKQIRNMNSGHAVLLYDTPGPNNSRDQSHSEITKQIIQNSSFCSLICILNATQLGTDDEFELLTFIRKEIEKKDTTSDVLFVLNKIDDFNLTEGDSIRDSLTICKKHLRDRLGFSDVTILPVSSRVALLIRRLLDSTTEMSPAEVLEAGGIRASRGTKYLRSSLSAMEQIRLALPLSNFIKRRRTYSSALKFSPPMKRLFTRLETKLKAMKPEHTKILIADEMHENVLHYRSYDIEDLKYALLLSGVPIVEKYLENKLKKAAK